MEVSHQLHTSVVYNWKKNLAFRLYAYMKIKIPFLYRESKDDSSATTAVVHSPFHLRYRGSEETGKYKEYEIQELLKIIVQLHSLGSFTFHSLFKLQTSEAYIHTFM
jgi:hypothetical protein